MRYESILPYPLYTPFKYSYIHIKNNHPDIDINPYLDLFWYAEKYYNATDKQLAPYKDEQF